MLLGASNLRRGLPAVLRAARARLGAPVGFLVACGAGRSFGAPTRVLGRGLSGILDCGLWPALAAAPPAPTWALLADVGNDVVYGAPPAAILGWVDGCLEPLDRAGARTAFALYPPAVARALPPWLFHAAGRVLYPLRRHDRARILRDLDAVDAGLRERAAARGAPAVELRPDWYGLDPVHLAGRHRAAAWGAVVDAWPAPPVVGAPHAAADDPTTLRVLLATPERRTLLGVTQRGAQPALTLRDGSTVALY